MIVEVAFDDISCLRTTMRTIGEHKQEPKQDKQAKLAVQHQQKTNNNPLFNNNPCHGFRSHK